MTEAEDRAAVVAIARRLIGTPYRHNARAPGAGLDCATLLEHVFNEAKIIPPFSIGAYSHQWHMHSDEPLYERAIIANGGRQVDQPTGAGDIVLYFQGRQFAHGAVITELEPLQILQAYAPSRCVIEGLETEFGAIANQKRKFFTLWAPA